MGFKEKINEVHESLTHPKVVKFCVISATLVWVLGICLALLVAQLDTAGTGFDLAGFNPAINYISDLGSLRYTPAPIIADFAMMQTSILMIPVSLYLKDILKGDGSKTLRKVLANLTLLCIIIALCGLFLTGVFSEDVGEKFDNLFPCYFQEYHLLSNR